MKLIAILIFSVLLELFLALVVFGQQPPVPAAAALPAQRSLVFTFQPPPETNFHFGIFWGTNSGQFDQAQISAGYTDTIVTTNLPRRRIFAVARTLDASGRSSVNSNIITNPPDPAPSIAFFRIQILASTNVDGPFENFTNLVFYSTTNPPPGGRLFFKPGALSAIQTK